MAGHRLLGEHGRLMALPLLGPVAALRLLESCDHATKVLEWGSGGSTLYLVQKLQPECLIFSLEHDLAWAERTRRGLVALAEAGLSRAAACVMHVPTIADGWRSVDPEGPFDLIFVDGAHEWRSQVCAEAFTHLAPGGRLVLDNAQERLYAPGLMAFEKAGGHTSFRVVDPDTHEMLWGGYRPR